MLGEREGCKAVFQYCGSRLCFECRATHTGKGAIIIISRPPIKPFFEWKGGGLRIYAQKIIAQGCLLCSLRIGKITTLFDKMKRVYLSI